MSPELAELLYQLRYFLGVPLFTLSEAPISLGTLLLFGLIVAGTFYLSVILRAGLARAFALRKLSEERKLWLFQRLTHYATLAIGLTTALQVVGIDLKAFFAAGAVFAVGIGFAMKNIAENFVSGVILLIESSIHPGDVLKLEGELVRVREMGIRSTTVQTLNGEILIVPNYLLVSNTVRNYSISQGLSRIRVQVGVAYESDMKRVRYVLEEAAADYPAASDLKPPLVLLSAFGDSSVDFDVFVWIEEAWEIPIRISELHEALWRALKREKIEIAYPQVDLHLDPPVADGLAKLSLLSGERS